MHKAFVGAVLLLLALSAVRAQNPVITSFSGNGMLGWEYPTNGITDYRIEYCSDLAGGRWTDLQCGLRGMSPTGSVMTAEVPMLYRVRAMGREPTNMVYVPPGAFDMGDTFQEGLSDEQPVHFVYVGAFYADKYEVTKDFWDEVYAWAGVNEYSFSNAGNGKATNHPVHTVSWYDCVKWANARSEREGLTPCYYTSSETTTIYRTGELEISNACVRWDADGYRLPTEAEWEKMARGGARGHRFSWADDTICFGRANYYSYWCPETGPWYPYDISCTNGCHPDYGTGAQPYTSPPGRFSGNGYGIYNVDGNVAEWCWDWYEFNYYSNSPQAAPHGPDYGSNRVVRGGFWYETAGGCRTARRNRDLPAEAYNLIGFRLVRRVE